MSTVDPYALVKPHKVTNPDGSPTVEFSQWLDYDYRWKNDMWRYTGAPTDEIGNAEGSISTVSQRVTALESSEFPTYTAVTANTTPDVNTWLNVTASSVLITLPVAENKDRVVVHKNTGLNSDYIDVTDGTGTKRITVDQALISFRYSSDLSAWVVGG